VVRNGILRQPYRIISLIEAHGGHDVNENDDIRNCAGYESLFVLRRA
jgi:hypothetical protein